MFITQNSKIINYFKNNPRILCFVADKPPRKGHELRIKLSHFYFAKGVTEQLSQNIDTLISNLTKTHSTHCTVYSFVTQTKQSTKIFLDFKMIMHLLI